MKRKQINALIISRFCEETIDILLPAYSLSYTRSGLKSIFYVDIYRKNDGKLALSYSTEIPLTGNADENCYKVWREIVINGLTVANAKPTFAKK